MAEYTFNLAEVVPTITFAETPITNAGENSLECLVSKQANPQHENLTGATFEYSSQVPGLPFLPAASLAACPLWLVFYECAFGGGPLAFGGAAIPQVEVMSNRGGINPPNSDKTYGGGEGAGLAVRTPESSRCNWMGGAFLFAPDGTDLEFRMRTTAGPPRTTFYSGMSLVALPVDVSPHNKRLHYASGGDLYGTQLALTGDPNVVVPTGTPWASVLETSHNLPAGNYLVIASMQGDTVANNTIQMRFLVDGALQKAPVVRTTENNRDDVPFFYASVHAFAGGTCTLRLEGGSGLGPDNKVFRKARIWIIDLNKFERYGAIRSDDPISLLNTDQFPTWNTDTSLHRTIVPFSGAGEYILSLGSSFASRTSPSGILSRIYNTTLSNAAHEHISAAQVDSFDPPASDLNTLCNVGCELSNISTEYELQHCGSTGVNAGDVTVSIRELILVGLTKKPGAAPPTVTLFVSDSCTTSESQSTPTSGIGVTNILDTCGTADFLNMLGEAPPAGIPDVHPRLWLTPAKLSYLRTQAGYDENGNVIGAGTTFWNDLVSMAGVSQYTCWGLVLRYKVTQNPAHLTAALAQLNRVCDENLNGYESNGLRMGVMQRQACLYYDWLYDELTTAQRQRLRDYIMGLAYFSLNNGSGVWSPSVIWSRNDPTNNYFMSWHEVGVYAAVTLYHDVWPNDPAPSFAWPPGSGQNLRSWWLPLRHAQTSGPTYIDCYEYIMARLSIIAEPVWNRVGPGGIVGGAWHEGSWYRPMWVMFETFRVLEETAGYFPNMPNVNFRDFGYYLLYSWMPGTRRHPELGDSGTPESRKEITGNDRVLMLYLADKYRNEPFGSYCQHWLNNVCTTVYPGRSTPDANSEYNCFDYWMYDHRITQGIYADVLPKGWFSASNQLLISRTGWGPNDTVVMLHSQDRIQAHEHGQNCDIQINSGRGGSNWDAHFLVGPRCAHGPSGENQSGDWRSQEHSTHKIAGFDQRYSGEVIYPGDDLASGSIPLHSINPVFVYGRAEAHDAYRQGISTYTNTQNPNLRTVNYFFREKVHILGPNIVCLYDRVQLKQTTPSGSPVEQSDISHFHYPDPGPVVLGEVMTLEVGTAKLYKKNLLPAGQASTLTDETSESPAPVSYPYNCWDESINLPVSGNFSRHMLAFEVESNASPGIAPINMWDSVGSTQYEGVTIDKGGARYHVGFTSNQTGAEPSNPFTYAISKATNADIHIITGLVPGQLYFVDESPSFFVPGLMQYQFTKAQIGFPADQGGVVMFTPAQLGDQTTAFIFNLDGCSTNEVTNLVATKYISDILDTCGTVDRTTLISAHQAVINVLDTCTTSEVVNPTPQLGGGIFDACSSAETVILTPSVVLGEPTFTWSEKEIEVGTNPLYPNADRQVSFFGMDPQDGAIFDKLADDDDATHIYTFGANANNAFLDFGLTPPDVYVGRIRLIQPVVRVLNCELGGSSGATLTFALSGLGLTVLTNTFRTQPLFTTANAVDLVFDPISVNISNTDFALMGMRLDISGTPIGNSFLLKLSRAYINILSSTPSEKVIS